MADGGCQSAVLLAKVSLEGRPKWAPPWLPQDTGYFHVCMLRSTWILRPYSGQEEGPQSIPGIIMWQE